MPSKAKPLPSLSVLREHFSYDPETGIVERIKANKYRPNNLGACNQLVKGRLVVKFNGAKLYIHRLAWKLQTGHEPPEEIDHKNRNPTDNKWSNLRACTSKQNSANCKQRSSQYPRGVKKVKNRFYATGLRGGYATPEEAHAAYRAWHLSYYGEFSVYAS